MDVAAHERELVSILDRTSHRIVELISHRFYQDKVWSLPTGEQAALLRKEAIHVTNAGMRFAKCLRMDVAFPFVCASMQVHDAASFIADRAAIVDRLRKLCDEMNVEYYREFDKDRASIVENVRSRCRFERLADHGPKMGAICGEYVTHRGLVGMCLIYPNLHRPRSRNPLVSTYFTRIPRTDRNHSLDVRSLAVVNNGWIWNADPLVDFASPASKSYLVREVIPWGDCVKLRYGRGRDDNPWLWDHIATYTKLMATYFHGFRIDNCRKW